MTAVDLGDVRVTILDAGSLWLDGGAMFGVVPKALWARERVPDDANRIELGMNVALVEDGRTRTLIDTGAGTTWTDKARSNYKLDPKKASEIVAQAGLRPEDIDRVVVSHLHFDHAGGNTERRQDGALAAAFPEAEYVMQRGEIELARRDNERIRASYVGEHFEPLLADSGRVRILDGDGPIAPGLEARLAPGHTPHMQVVLVNGGRRTLAFLSDLVPTASHLRYPYIMGYDLEPLTTLATKKRILPEAVREGWFVVFEHDRVTPLAVLRDEDGNVVAHPVESE